MLEQQLVDQFMVLKQNLLTSSSNAVSVINNDNIYFTAPQIVASEINETNEMSGNKSLYVNLSLTTTNTKLFLY